MFKNYMARHLSEAIETYGDEIVEDIKLPAWGLTFLERMLECIVLAHSGPTPDYSEVRKRVHHAMKNLVGEGLPRSDKEFDVEELRWMADEYVADRSEAGREMNPQKPRSIEDLAFRAATSPDGELDEAKADRLRHRFSAERKMWLRLVTPKALEIEMVHRGALWDISERLEILGIPMFPED